MVIKEYTLDNKIVYLTAVLEQYVTMLSDNDRLDFVVSNADYSDVRHEKLLVRHIKPLILERAKNDINSYIRNSLITYIRAYVPTDNNEETE